MESGEGDDDAARLHDVGSLPGNNGSWRLASPSTPALLYLTS
jgi:hypothetical protein